MVGGVAADLVGFRSVFGALTGEDPFTLEKWTTLQRVVNGTVGAIQMIQTATGMISVSMPR